MVETVRQLYMDGPCRILLAISPLKSVGFGLSFFCPLISSHRRTSQ